MQHNPKQIYGICGIVAAVFAVDQLTKWIAMRTIPAGSINPWPNVDSGKLFWFTHERNPGVVGGMFRDIPGAAIVLGIIACGVLAYLYLYLDRKSILQTLAYGLVAGGAAGNMIDRLIHGSVTDFLQFNLYFIPFDFPWKLWPAFNVADMGIVCGIFLLIITWHHADLKSSKESKEHVADTS